MSADVALETCLEELFEIGEREHIFQFINAEDMVAISFSSKATDWNATITGR
jgi:hypothetical protein